MNTINWQRKSTVVAALLIAVAVSGTISPAQAQFSSPPGQGTPKGTAGGGSRPIDPSACFLSTDRREVPRAMAPTNTVGLTSQANPTVWVYVPDTKAKTLEFSLVNQEQEGIYQVNLPINTPGLVKVTLPANVLQAGKPYYWSVALVCNPDQRTDDWVVGSSIRQQPLPADLQRQLSRATADQQVRLYAQAGFWYEAFNTYLTLRQAQPANTNLSELWTELLKIADIGTITQKPL